MTLSRLAVEILAHYERSSLTQLSENEVKDYLDKVRHIHPGDPRWLSAMWEFYGANSFENFKQFVDNEPIDSKFYNLPNGKRRVGQSSLKERPTKRWLKCLLRHIRLESPNPEAPMPEPLPLSAIGRLYGLLASISAAGVPLTPRSAGILFQPSP